MSINIKNDPLRSAILFGRPVLFASQRIPREEVPEGWYYYELRGSVRNAKKPVALSDHAYVNPIGSVLSPVPLKRADTISRRVNGQFLLLGETMTLGWYVYQPTQADYKVLAGAVDDYLQVFQSQEEAQENSPQMC